MVLDDYHGIYQGCAPFRIQLKMAFKFKISYWIWIEFELRQQTKLPFAMGFPHMISTEKYIVATD